MARELARAMAKALSTAGVTTMFGVPGGGPNLEMIGAAQEFGIDFVLAHGETAACVMASTHGRVTGGVGIAIVTRGPGLTSAINGLAQATLDRSPLVLISDTVPAAQSDRTAHQRLDQVAKRRARGERPGNAVDGDGHLGRRRCDVGRHATGPSCRRRAAGRRRAAPVRP